MISKFAHLMLVATSLAPVLLTWAVAIRGREVWPYVFVGGAVALLCICMFALRAAQAKLERHSCKLKSIEAADHDVLTFLIAYLLPLLGADALKSDLDALPLIVAVGIISLVVFQSGLAHVNPLMSIFGWRFYKIVTQDECTHLLVSRSSLVKARNTKTVVHLSSAMMMSVEKE